MNINLHNHFIVKVKKTDGSEQTYKAYNLVTDYGKSQVLNAKLPTYIHMGTGTTAPAVTDKTLAKKVLAASAASSSSYNSLQLTVTRTMKMTIDESTAQNTDFTEIGVGDSSYVYTRALFTDAHGSPIVVPKGPNDIMEVTAIIYITIPSSPSPDLMPGGAGYYLYKIARGTKLTPVVSLGGVPVAGNVPLMFGATSTGASLEGAVASAYYNAGMIGAGDSIGSKGSVLYRGLGCTLFDEQKIPDFELGNGNGSQTVFPIIYPITNKDSIVVKKGGVIVDPSEYTIEYFGALPLLNCKNDSKSLLYPAKAGADNKIFNECCSHLMSDSGYNKVLYSINSLPYTRFIFANNPHDSSESPTVEIGIHPAARCNFGGEDSGTDYGYIFINGEWAVSTGDALPTNYSLFKYDPITGNTETIWTAQELLTTSWGLIPLGDNKEDGFITPQNILTWNAETSSYEGKYTGNYYPTSLLSSTNKSTVDLYSYLTGDAKSTYNYWVTRYMYTRGKYHESLERVESYASRVPSAQYNGTTYSYKYTDSTIHCWDPITGNIIFLDKSTEVIWFGKATFTWDSSNKRYNITNLSIFKALSVDTDLQLFPYGTSGLGYSSGAIVNKNRLMLLKRGYGYDVGYCNEVFIDFPDWETSWEANMFESPLTITKGYINTETKYTGSQDLLSGVYVPVFYNDKYLVTSNGGVLATCVYQIKFNTPPTPEDILTADFGTNILRKDSSWNFSTSQTIGYVE